MNEKIKKYVNKTTILFAVCIIYIILIKTVDVAPIGPEGSSVGFSKLNDWVRNMFPYNEGWYTATKYLGYMSFLLVLYYGCIGLLQFIKKKNLMKIDKKLLILACFYVLVGATYIFFEKIVINYRPVILEEGLEASFPSSHTMLALCVCASSMLISKDYFKDKRIHIAVDLMSGVLMVVLVIGRTISGVHWITDIIGGILISAALLSLFYDSIKRIRVKKKTTE